MTKNFRSLVIGAALSFFFAGGAQAQLDNQSGAASAGRVDEQLNVREFQPRVMPRIEVKEANIQSAPAGSEKISFKLERLKLEGASAYHGEELASVYQGSIGQTITLADLYGIAGNLTKKYRNDGYILTQVVVPPQTIEGGTARLQVVEGYVANVDVRGEGEFIDDAVMLARNYAALVRHDTQALNVKQLERTMLLINDIPGISARGVLSPARGVAGAADLTIIIERKRYEATLGVDNYGTKFLGPIQVMAAGAINSLMGFNERITTQIVYAPNSDLSDELIYLGLGYKMPIWKGGTFLDVNITNTMTDPGFRLDEFDVQGNSKTMSVMVGHPFIRSRNLNFTGRMGFDYRDVKTENNIEERRLDQVRVAVLGADVEFIDTLGGVGYNMWNFEVRQGIDVLDATEENDPNVSRVGANPDFLKLEIELQRLQRIADRVNLLLGVKGQVSRDELFSSEEMGIGGMNYGRGYDPSEIIGDSGIAGKLEVQWNEPREWSFLETYQLYGFWDIGEVWNKNEATSALKNPSLASGGLGVRASITPNNKMDFTLAFPFTRDVQTMGDQDPRFFFSIKQTF